jgi:hypothetical protein
MRAPSLASWLGRLNPYGPPLPWSRAARATRRAHRDVELILARQEAADLRAEVRLYRQCLDDALSAITATLTAAGDPEQADPLAAIRTHAVIARRLPRPRLAVTVRAAGPAPLWAAPEGVPHSDHR